jgi:predicted lipid-binding transport protein (Tim44 family)
VPSIELIILAAVAVFVISRLYAVLGTKTGTEQPARRYNKEAVTRRAEQPKDEDAQVEGEERPRIRAAFTGPAAAGLEAIATADPQFNPEDFTKGARRAYELIVTAFADGDRTALKSLVDDDVFEAYSQAISDREKAGTEAMRLARLRSARIAEASLDESKMARIAGSFESELSDGDAMRTAREIWTFKRSLKTQDPNWLLDEVATAS